MSVQDSGKHTIPGPAVHQDNEGFWAGVKRGELVFQRCRDCGKWVHPPRPMCPGCRSLQKEWAPSKGKGKVYSWVTYRESPHPGFPAPYSVVLVELKEGVRVVSNLVDTKHEEITIGMRVEVVFDHMSDNFTLPRFRKVD